MPQFNGSYTRQAGSRRHYTYTLTYGMRGVALGWMAAVHHGDSLKGHPEGEVTFALPPGEDEQRATAQQQAHEAIESLIGMDE